MTLELHRTDQSFQFEATDGTHHFSITAAPSLAGAKAEGLRPMQVLLTSLASCMSIDVLNILYKQRQDIRDYRVTVNAERSDEVPAVFTRIDLLIIVKGNLGEEKVKRAIKLSEEKYCSVHRMLSPTVEINTSFHIDYV